MDRGLARNAALLPDPLGVLRALGGRELAAIFGAVLAARLQKTPVLLDGFVAAAAAAPLFRLVPDGLAHALAGHVSAEHAHRKLLGLLGLVPLLALGAGSALAGNILRGALACLAGMATFAEAGVSDS